MSSAEEELRPLQPQGSVLDIAWVVVSVRGDRERRGHAPQGANIYLHSPRNRASACSSTQTQQTSASLLLSTNTHAVQDPPLLRVLSGLLAQTQSSRARAIFPGREAGKVGGGVWYNSPTALLPVTLSAVRCCPSEIWEFCRRRRAGGDHDLASPGQTVLCTRVAQHSPRRPESPARGILLAVDLPRRTGGAKSMVKAAGCAASVGHAAVPLLLLTVHTGAFVNPLLGRTATTAVVGKHQHVGSVPRRVPSPSSPRSAAGAVDAVRGGVTMASSGPGAGKGKEELFWLEGERDACGVGFIANPKPEHKVVELGLSALGCMEHRGACLADNV